MFRLPVRVRWTELGDGRREESLFVHCPVANEVRPLIRCLECKLAVDFPVDQLQGAAVLCRAAGPHPPSPHRRASEVPVAAVMDERVTCVDPGLSLDEVAEVLVRCGQHCAPVVDEDGRFVGIVSSRDVVRAQPPGASALGVASVGLGLTVADVMSTPVHTVRAHCTVAEAAALMSRESVHQLPVVSDDDEVVGLISSLDLAKWIDQPR